MDKSFLQGFATPYLVAVCVNRIGKECWTKGLRRFAKIVRVRSRRDTLQKVDKRGARRASGQVRATVGKCPEQRGDLVAQGCHGLTRLLRRG
jgi:hypothetical protein